MVSKDEAKNRIVTVYNGLSNKGHSHLYKLQELMKVIDSIYEEDESTKEKDFMTYNFKHKGDKDVH